MRFLITSDIHIQNGGMFSKPLGEGLSTRAQTAFNFIDWLLTFQDINALIICGDLFTQKNAIQTPLFNRAWSAMHEVAYRHCPIFAIPGNHDRYMESEDVHSLFAFGEGIEDFFILAPDYVDVAGGEVEIFGVPAGKGFQPLPKKQTDRRIMVMHENIAGARFPTGYVSKNARYTPKEIVDYKKRNEVDVVLCGDIHLGQVLSRGRSYPYPAVAGEYELMDDGIFIPGSPYQMDFGDEGTNKGVLVFDTDEDVIHFVPYFDGPQFVTITDKTFREDMEPEDNRFYRFQMTKFVEEAEKLVKQDGFKGRSIVEYIPVQGTALDFSQTDTYDYENLIPEYVKQRGGGDKKLIQTGVDFYTQAKQLGEN